MKKTTIRTKITGIVLAAVCAFSTMAAVSAVSASAATVNSNAAVAAQSQGKACTYTMQGKNWTYWLIDNVNVSIKCNINFSNGTCKFIVSGVQPGVVNAVLKTERTDGKWNNAPIRFTVDSNLNVTGTQTGNIFVTNTKYEG